MIRLVPALALILAAGAAAARPAMTTEETTMRAAPSSHARAVQHIPARAQIDVGECRARWCAASWRDLDGWVSIETVGPNDAPLAGGPPPGPRAYYSGPVVFGPVIGFGYYSYRHW